MNLTISRWDEALWPNPHKWFNRNKILLEHFVKLFQPCGILKEKT